MTSKDAEPASLDQKLAAARRKVDKHLLSIARAMERESVAATETEKSNWLKYGVRKRLDIINVTLDACRLIDQNAPEKAPGNHELRYLERRWGLPEGVFRNETWREELARQREFLEVAKDLAEAELAMEHPPRPDWDYIGPIIRISCAVIVGAGVAAPLGALAIGERVVSKIIEAAVVVGISATAAEGAVWLSERLRPPALPPTPASERRISIIDRAIDKAIEAVLPSARIVMQPGDPSYPHVEPAPATSTSPPSVSLLDLVLEEPESQRGELPKFDDTTPYDPLTDYPEQQPHPDSPEPYRPSGPANL